MLLGCVGIEIYNNYFIGHLCDDGVNDYTTEYYSWGLRPEYNVYHYRFFLYRLLIKNRR